MMPPALAALETGPEGGFQGGGFVTALSYSDIEGKEVSNTSFYHIGLLVAVSDSFYQR